MITTTMLSINSNKSLRSLFANRKFILILEKRVFSLLSSSPFLQKKNTENGYEGAFLTSDLSGFNGVLFGRFVSAVPLFYNREIITVKSDIRYNMLIV